MASHCRQCGGPTTDTRENSARGVRFKCDYGIEHLPPGAACSMLSDDEELLEDLLVEFTGLVGDRVQLTVNVCADRYP